MSGSDGPPKPPRAPDRTVIDEDGAPGEVIGVEPSGPQPRTVIDEDGPAALRRLHGSSSAQQKPSGPLPRTVIDDDIGGALARVADAQETGELKRRLAGRKNPASGSEATAATLSSEDGEENPAGGRKPSVVAPTAPTMLHDEQSAETMWDEVSAKRRVPTSPPPAAGGGTVTWVPEARNRRARVLEAEARAASASASFPSDPGLSSEIGEGVDPAEELIPGDHILQYELIRELGHGGMGHVWLARDTRLGRKVAVKVLNRVSERFTERFLIEARATARCEHENIVVIHDVNAFGGQPFMVLEYLEGEPLSRLLRGSAIPPLRAVELMVPVVRALVRAHEFNIVHRDLKPDNIIVRNNGAIKVLDFGIAKLYTVGEMDSATTPRPEDLEALKDVGITREGALLGTMLYMSPEQWGAGGVDHRTDLWAVGLMLYEMVAGRHPLVGMTPTELMSTAALLEAPMPSVGEAVPDLPGELERIIDHCLHKRKEDRFDSAQSLLDALESLLPSHYGRQLAADESPYPGLSAFQEADAGRFFGRGKDVTRAVARMRDLPLVGVVGPSGVGKSSFVRAGVVPALKGSGEEWETFIVRPGRNPVAALASLIQPLTRSGSTGEVSGQMATHSALLTRLRDEPGYLGSLLRKRARRKRGSILLFVDQFEELYTLVSDPVERALYTACLAGVADDVGAPLRVCISMRSDFLDRAAEDQRFMEELTRGLIFLQPPDAEGLREAIVGPLELVGYRFENDDMVATMLTTLEQTPGALPLLQFSAAKLWDSRDRRAKLLTQDSFDAMGGIAGALATHADEVYAGLSPQDQAIAKSVLLQLVTPDGTRAIVEVWELKELSSVPDDVQRVVDYLVGSRLLVIQSRSDAEGHAVEIVHESLIDSWPMLRRWQDEGHEDAVFLEQLRNAAKQWDAKERPQGMLWRGDAMQEARLWHNRYEGELAKVQQEFLDAVFELATRSARRRRALVSGIIGFLLVVLAAAGVALFYIRQAEQNARIQARIAREKEKEVKEKLVQIKREQAERARAEKEARSAKVDRDKTQIKLDLSYKDLKKAYQQARGEQKKAEAEKKKAEAEKRKAELATVKAREANRATVKALAQARKATENERRAKAEAQRLLRVEQIRAARYRKQLQKITKGLK